MTKIEWTNKTWNPITGCTKISEGCHNCYAERMATRLRGRFGYPKDDPFYVTLHEDRLEQLLHWHKPQMIFVCSMGDLFHEYVDEISSTYVRDVFAFMAASPQHTFQVLTKRAHIAKLYFDQSDFAESVRYTMLGVCADYKLPVPEMMWPLPNVWLGVTAENQKQANLRIPILLDIPAAVHFVSIEPMLGAINLQHTGCPEPIWDGPYRMRCNLGGNGNECGKHGKFLGLLDSIDWVICGGETGPGARPMHPDWARSLRDQCIDAGVPFFFKQWGAFLHKSQMIDDVHCNEFVKVTHTVMIEWITDFLIFLYSRGRNVLCEIVDVNQLQDRKCPWCNSRVNDDFMTVVPVPPDKSNDFLNLIDLFCEMKGISKYGDEDEFQTSA